MTNETPQPNTNIRRQLCTEMTAFIDFSGEGSALITGGSRVAKSPQAVGPATNINSSASHCTR
jgi:hypothetical protein